MTNTPNYLWKETIEILDHSTHELMRQCSCEPFCFFPRAYKAISSGDFTHSSKLLRKQIVCVRLCDIGVVEKISIGVIETAGNTHKLRFCVPGDAPYVRLQITDQQEPVIYMAMRPIRNTEGVSCIFALKKVEDMLVLDAEPVTDVSLSPDVPFIFCSYQ